MSHHVGGNLRIPNSTCDKVSTPIADVRHNVHYGAILQQIVAFKLLFSE